MLRRIWVGRTYSSAAMAAEEVADAADAAAGHLRVRRQRGQVWPELGMLAKAFEDDQEIRAIFRNNKGHLLSWPSPQTVGCASLKALALNVPVVKLSLQIWGAVMTSPKSMAIDWLKKEATCLCVTPGYRSHTFIQTSQAPPKDCEHISLYRSA